MKSLTGYLWAFAASSPGQVSDYMHAASTTAVNESSVSAIQPCAEISSILANSTSARTPLPYDTALECLRTVPLDVEGDRSQLKGIAAFADWQSTLAYLKDPPPGYLYPAVDIMAGLSQLSDDLSSDVYANEFDFQYDIYRLINSARDGHFTYIADVAGVFLYKRLDTLVSVSVDGLQLPEVYTLEDVRAAVRGNGTGIVPSAITQINGQGVEEFLNNLAFQSGYNQDPDANYNAVFPIVPQAVAGLPSASPGYFQLSRSPQGNVTNLTFKNGTKKSRTNSATTSEDFTGVTDGASFFQKFCLGPTGQTCPTDSASETSNPSTPSSTQSPFSPIPTETSLPALQFYPHPLNIASDNSISGYFPSEHSDLAVLAILTFKPRDNVEFQNVVRQFLASAKASNKTKFLIDLRGNPGGESALAYDLFEQLFPSTTPYGTSNYRATPLFDLLGEISSDFFDNVTSSEAYSNFSTYASNGYNTPFNVREDLTSGLTKFASWAELFGPHEVHGDNFTSLIRYNLSDPISLDGVQISNYGNLTGFNPAQVFRPANIALIQDGQCASTCALFSEMVKSQANIKQIVFGGRKQYGPMQGVGGVKGANIYEWDSISNFCEGAYEIASPAQSAKLNQTYGSTSIHHAHALLRASSSGGSHAASSNVRNNIRHGDDTVTPLQFVYEAADCRLFYTAPMLFDQSKVWLAAYNSMFRNGSCVAGSTGAPSSQPGTDYILSGVDSNATNFFGANFSAAEPSAVNSAWDIPASTATASGTASGTAAALPSGTVTGSSTSTASGPVQQSNTASTAKAAAFLTLGAAMAVGALLEIQ